MGEAETALLVPNDSELTYDGHTALSRKEKRKGRKKLKRKERRQQAAEQARQEDEQALQDPSFLEEKAQALEKERLEHELQLQLWLRKEKEAQEEADRKRQEAAEAAVEVDDESAWDYVEEGPAEIIWEGNEIIVRKQKVKVPKAHRKEPQSTEDDHPVSNPLLPESLYRSSVSKPLPSQNLAFEDHKKLSNNEHNPNFGTEQDKTHCPFHIKTGVCRFGVNCSRAHVYPDKSCTLLIKNMYNGPGLPLEHDEGLEYTDEEVLQKYEEFFEDVHGEFLKHGEIVNFKVCRNESSHLRGNVYVQFQSIESALTAYSALNGRFYAAKQITCEFVVVTRWRAALCGEYMRSHHKVCSHGTACNFLHCFRNPCGLYEWADWDNPPPRSFSATGRRSRGDYKEDEYNHKHHDRSDRHHREGFSSKSRRSHQYDSGRISRERRHGRSCSYDSSCEESLPIDKDQVQKERRNRSSKERYKAGHSSKRSSEESMLVERDGLQKGKRHRSSERRSAFKLTFFELQTSKVHNYCDLSMMLPFLIMIWNRSREGGDQTRRKEDARKRRHRSRSQDRHERKRHHGSRRVAEDKKIVLRRGHRSRSPESSESDGGSSCELMQASYERYRPRSRSHSSVSLEQSPEDEVVSKRRKSRSRSDKRKRRHS